MLQEYATGCATFKFPFITNAGKPDIEFPH